MVVGVAPLLTVVGRQGVGVARVPQVAGPPRNARPRPRAIVARPKAVNGPETVAAVMVKLARITAVRRVVQGAVLVREAALNVLRVDATDVEHVARQAAEHQARLPLGDARAHGVHVKAVRSGSGGHCRLRWPVRSHARPGAGYTQCEIDGRRGEHDARDGVTPQGRAAPVPARRAARRGGAETRRDARAARGAGGHVSPQRAAARGALAQAHGAPLVRRPSSTPEYGTSRHSRHQRR